MSFATWVRTAAAAALCGALAGCGGVTGPSVNGQVKLDGQPLAGAQVQFVPKTDPNLGQGTATTDAGGNFTIAPDAHGNNLLKPGTYRVAVHKTEMKGGASSPGGGMGSMVDVVPKEYSAAKSRLVAEIREGNNSLQPFDLRSPKR